MTRDWSTNTPDQAAALARAQAYPDFQDERDEPGERRELTHAHGPGLLCLACAAADPFRRALAAAGDTHFVCDDCLALYDPDEGCIHSRYLCPQCLDRCRECVDEQVHATAAERAEERWRER